MQDMLCLEEKTGKTFLEINHSNIFLEQSAKAKEIRANNNNRTSVQFSSLAQSCPTLCDPRNLSTPGLPAHYQIPEFTQTHVH